MEIKFTSKSNKKYLKLTTKNPKLQEKILDALVLLQSNPGDPKLKTHKVYIRNFGQVYSSSVTGDIRLIWNYADKMIIIYILDIGGHSGKQGVYK